jgi:uncharacterized protein (DUF433 family)
MDAPITVDPDILGGTPVFPHSRVPIQNLFDYLEGGYTVHQFLASFPGIAQEQVKAVLSFAAEKALCDLSPVE